MMPPTKENKIGVAVIGLGYWGPNLVRNALNHPRIRVEAVCDQDPNRLARYENLVPIKTQAFDDLLQNKDIEALVMATPVDTHYALGTRALEADKHVWIEKPLASTLGEASKMVELAERKKKILFVDHTFLFHPAVIKAKEIIDSGELGEIFYFDSTRINLGLLQQDVNVIWDLAPHDLSILNYLLGILPHSVTAIGASHNIRRLEDIAYVTFRYHEGILAHLNFNWFSPVKVRRILVGGSKKMLVYDDLDQADKIKVYDKGITVYGGQLDEKGRHQMLINYRMGDMRAPHLDNTEALSNAMNHFVQCILEEKKPVSDGQEGLKVVSMIEAIQSSLKQSGQLIPLSLNRLSSSVT